MVVIAKYKMLNICYC